MLNADDDFVCPAELAQPDVIVGEQPGALLLVTRSGSHVAFNEGVTGTGSFHLRVSLDFLEAARQTATAGEQAAAVWVPPRPRDVIAAQLGFPVPGREQPAAAGGAAAAIEAEAPAGFKGVVVPTRRAAASGESKIRTVEKEVV